MLLETWSVKAFKNTFVVDIDMKILLDRILKDFISLL